MFDEAVKKGLTDLTIFRVTEGWQASSRWRDSQGWRVNIHKDLGTAVNLATATATVEEDDGSDLV